MSVGIPTSYTVTDVKNTFSFKDGLVINFQNFGIGLAHGYTQHIYCGYASGSLSYRTDFNASGYSGYVTICYTKN